MSLEELYQMYAKDILRFSFWLSGDRDLAKDITSETFFKVMNNLGKIRTETLKGLLLTIARNIYFDYKRKQKRQTELENITDSLIPGPEKDTENKSQLERIYMQLQNFPEIDRTAFLLRFESEMDYEEISHILEISVSSAKVKVFRVRKKIIEKNITREI